MIGDARSWQIGGGGEPASPNPTSAGRSRLTRWIRNPAAILVPLLAPVLIALVQSLLTPFLHPFAFFLFYPGVLLSAWIAGTAGGLVATILSTLLAWWLFVAPERLLAEENLRSILSAAVFLLVGIVFSVVEGRLKRSNQQIANSLQQARLAAKRLKAAHGKIAGLVEQASDGIFVADLSGHLLEVNEAGCRLLGYGCEQRDRMIGQSFEAFLDPANIRHLWELKERLLSGETQIAEWNLLRQDGTALPVEISARIFPDGRWQIFARDITERKAAERRLRQVDRANRALTRCNQTLIRAKDENTLLAQICAIVVQDAGYPLCWVGRAMQDEEKTVKVVARAGHNADYAMSLGISWADNERGRGPTGRCIRTRWPVTARDIAFTSDMAPWREAALAHGYASSLAIPLLIGEETFGALNIYAPERDAFDTEELRLLTELAGDLAFGISVLRTRAAQIKAEDELRTLNAELEQRVLARTRELQQAREQEFQIGSRIQQTLLLDRPPAQVPGVSIAALALPTQRVDGDFVLFTEPQADAFDVAVGDVMGKGIPAALVGAAAKAHLLKALGQLAGCSAAGELPQPESIVTRAHAAIARQLMDLDSFVTLCYARIDPPNSVVELVDCGHTGLIQLHSRLGKAELRRGDNLPLGVREDEVYRQSGFPLQAGDSLILFSDGITEARNEQGEAFGVERLEQCIENQRRLEPEELVEAIRAAVFAHCRSRRVSDDVTLVAVHVEKTGAPVARAEMQIGSELAELRAARAFTRSFCQHLPGAPLGEAGIAALALAVNETASNIIKHAYRGRPHRGIHIEAEAYRGYVTMRLRHGGCAFVPGAAGRAAIDMPRESGLGLYMVSQCVDDIEYAHDEQVGNCISLTKFADRHPSRESEAPWIFPSKSPQA